MKPYSYPGPKWICAAAKSPAPLTTAEADESNALFVAACVADGECSGDVWQVTKDADGATSFGVADQLVVRRHPTARRLGDLHGQRAHVVRHLDEEGQALHRLGAFTNGAYKRNEYVVPVTRGLHDMGYELRTRRYPIERVASCYLESRT